MSELKQGKGIFSGVSFEGEITENQVVENAGTIRNAKLPTKVGFWQKL